MNENNINTPEIVPIDKSISYITPTMTPLSSNVVIIEGLDAIWLYDVGSHPAVPDMINSLAKNKGKNINVILSHFHTDHIYNLNKINYTKLYQGKNTYGYTHHGEITISDTFISDGSLSMQLFPLPSTHAKGSLALSINDTYCLLGDALYPNKKGNETVYNVSLLSEAIQKLKSVPTAYFLLSHKTPFVQNKYTIIRWLEDIYKKRTNSSPYIILSNP